MLLDPEDIIKSFNATFPGKTINKDDLRAWVNAHFGDPGSDLVPWTPPDFQDDPPLLQKISDASLRDWANSINKLWTNLGRSQVADVGQNQQRHSLISLPNPLIGTSAFVFDHMNVRLSVLTA
jgi:alpha,alpha-trehalase